MKIFCQGCQEERKITFNCCPECGDQICIVCGCTSEEGCTEGCSWERMDLCDLCVDGKEISDEARYFIIQGSFKDFDQLKQDAAKGGTIWTVLKNAKHADRVFFYIVGPVSAIVGDGVIFGDVWTNDEFGSPWEGYPMAEIMNISFYDAPVPIKVLRYTFGEDWKHWKYPVCNREVPFKIEILRPFLELVEQHNRKNYSANFVIGRES